MAATASVSQPATPVNDAGMTIDTAHQSPTLKRGLPGEHPRLPGPGLTGGTSDHRMLDDAADEDKEGAIHQHHHHADATPNHPVRVIAPVSHTIDAHELKRQVVYDISPKGDVLVALLAYSAPIPGVQRVFRQFGKAKAPLSAAAAAQQPYFPFADLPNIYSAHADTAHRDQIASDTVLPGYHCYELPSFNAHDPSNVAAVYDGWHDTMYHYIDVEFASITTRHAVVNHPISHQYYVERVKNVPYFYVSWPDTAPSINDKHFTFRLPANNKQKPPRNVRDTVANSNASNSAMVVASHASPPLHATWRKRGPSSNPCLATIGFTAQLDRTPLHSIVEAFKLACMHTAYLLDAWQLHRGKHNADRSRIVYHTNGQFLALVALLDHCQPAKVPGAIRPTLPGFLHVSGKTIPLRYLDRREWCPICKPEEYHSRDECPRLDCPHCKTKGQHFAYKCPTRKSDDAAAKPKANKTYQPSDRCDS